MLAIVDYKAGNQTSVARALNHLDIPWIITSKPDELKACDGVIFPGVGAAAQAMAELSRTGLDMELKDAVARNQPLLGICLGSQIILEKSAEGNTTTLGIIKGQCKRFKNDLYQEDGSPAKIPHMGWNKLNVKRQNKILHGIAEESEFYFVHSYYVEPDPQLVIATSKHGIEFCSLYGHDGLWCAQFHPEKSGRPGLKLLENFNRYCREKSSAL